MMCCFSTSGRLVENIVEFLEMRPDRATQVIKHPLFLEEHMTIRICGDSDRK
jgi:hypothetical protein